MSKWKFLFDTHMMSTNELIIKLPPSDFFNENFIWGGDNFDIVNCKKSEVALCQAKIDSWRKSIGNRFRTGNHEAQRDMDVLYVLPGTRTGVMHGDIIFWGHEKSEKYRQKKHGAGFLKRGLWVNALEAFENGYNRKVKNDDLERFYQLALHWNVDRIICGHLHPDKHLEIDYKGRRLTVCKRGLTELEIK